MQYKKGRKRLLALALVFAITTASFVPVYAAQKLYDQKTTEMVTRGVTYEKNRRLTAEGWLDLHVLKVDLTDEMLRIAPTESAREFGLKETVQKLIADNGALAGVNADFFGLNGTYGASFGPVVRDGEIISVGTDRNLSGGEYASFFLDENGNPFIDYLKFEADFFVNEGAHLALASYNKITKMEYPIYFDRHAGETTAALDARFPNLGKFVVENGVITKISEKGETVTVPENGYLIVMNEKFYNDVVACYQVGQKAELRVTTSVDLSAIETAIGGAGKILTAGQQTQDSGLVITGRQPRTALGITQDKKTLILMVADGRTHSIGATQAEIAGLMQEYGAYEAMHLDGGGSSTMAVKTVNDNEVGIKNTVSEGSPRRVMNALGIYSNAPVGDVVELVVKAQERAFVGNPVTLSVFGYDAYYHKIPIDLSQVTFSSSDGSAVVNGSTVTLQNTGTNVITAQWNDLTDVVSIIGMTAASITATPASISLSGAGQTAAISVSGISTDGYTAPIAGDISYTLSDPGLGTISGHTFTAQANGAGYITASLGGAVCYIPVAIGGETKAVHSFDTMPGLSFSSYPEGIAGTAGISNQYYNEGKGSLALTYAFGASKETQAAYLNFKTPLKISGEPTALKLSIFGNGAGHWVRAKAADANGKEIVLDFAKDVSWNGTWQEVTAAIPAGTAYPISLKSIYAAALENTDTTKRALYFDKLSGVYTAKSVEGVPSAVKLPDPLQGSVASGSDGAYYIQMIGRTSGTAADANAYTTARAAVRSAVEKGANLAVYAGPNDVTTSGTVDTLQWNGSYRVDTKGGAAIVQLSGASGGLRTTNAGQWLHFKQDILASGSKHAIFVMDKTPSAFNDALETALFRSVLAELQKEGIHVFVVSASGAGYWSNVKDGVRYINLPSLWTADGVRNTDYRMLKLRIDGDTIRYEVVKI